MNEQPPNTPRQNLNISDGASLENAQLGGIAGRDLNVTQIRGQVVYATVYDRFHTPDGLSQRAISTAKPLTSEEYRNRQILLGKVKNIWIKGYLEQSLHTKALIELGLEERSEAVHHPFSDVEEFSSKSRGTLPKGTKATDVFEQMGIGRTLLVLGEPGSGKTITLLKLAQSLIIGAESNPNLTIPVVFNLSSWASKRQTISEWLAQELDNKYNFPKALGKILVEEQQLLLLLDGLDEVKAEHRNTCVQRLNQFIKAHGMTEMVICCRIQDYEILSERLKLQSAICIQTLTPEQIYHYLEQAGEQLVALKTLLQQDSELRSFATSPLILSVMSLAYQGCSLEELLPLGTAEERYQTLFNAYIERMFQRRGTTQKYPKEQTKCWLNWLAKNMVREYQTVFLIEQIQQSWLPKSFQRAIYIICILTFLGTIFGLFFGLILGLIQGTKHLIEFAYWGEMIIRGELRTYEFASWEDFFKTVLLDRIIFKKIILQARSYALCGATLGMLHAILLAEINNYNKLIAKVTGILKSKLINFLFAIIGISLALTIIGISLGLIPYLEIHPQVGFLIAFVTFLFLFDQTIRFQPIQPVETMNWSWIKAKSNFFPIIRYSVLISLLLGTLSELPYTFFLFLFALGASRTTVSILDFLIRVTWWVIVRTFFWLFVGLVAGCSVGIVVGLVLGYERGYDVDIKVVSNQGIWKSLANVRKLVIRFSFFCLLIFGITGGLVVWGEFQLIIALTSGLVGALIGVFCGGLIGGQGSGIVCIKHFILRVILGVTGMAPWNFARFLDYATERIFIQKVGGSYIFVHRMLLEHFAKIELKQR